MNNFIWLCSRIPISAYFPVMGYHACSRTHQTARRQVTVTPRILALSYKQLLVLSFGITSHIHKNTNVRKIFS